MVNINYCVINSSTIYQPQWNSYILWILNLIMSVMSWHNEEILSAHYPFISLYVVYKELLLKIGLETCIVTEHFESFKFWMSKCHYMAQQVLILKIAI